MFDTNQLLSVAFTLIANFANIVGIPQQAVPQHASDLQKCIIGRGGAPIFIYMVERTGVEFGIDHGVVCRYSAPGDFFSLQDPALVPNYVGTGVITPNEAVLIASNVLRSLTKRGDPLSDGLPRVQTAGNFIKQNIPFFQITWPHKGPGSSTAAKVDIDGRTGGIVDIHLWAEEFYDLAFEEDLRKRVHASEAKRPAAHSDLNNFSKPETNHVAELIPSWLLFCEKLGIQPGSQTNLADVDWNATHFYPYEGIYSNGVIVEPLCLVKFRAGSVFTAMGTTIVSATASDVAYTEVGRPQEFTVMSGHPVKTWEQLANALENRMRTELGVPDSFFAKTRTTRSTIMIPALQLTRANVYWARLPVQQFPDLQIEELRSFFTAQFDLESGELKAIHFRRPDWTEAIWQALRLASGEPRVRRNDLLQNTTNVLNRSVRQLEK
jgi:hypothetical protein